MASHSASSSSSRSSSAAFIPRYVQRNVRNSLTYLFLLLAFLALAVGVYKGGVHLARLKPEQVSLGELPWALFLSLARITLSYLASLCLSLVLGLLAARTSFGERLIIPALEILQSIPVIGFFPAAITFFIGLSHGQRFGVEMAAAFLILTSQAWNMSFAVYEATKGIPQDNIDAVFSFGVTGSQRFWKLYAPACVPRLIYSSILSWSNGWYFLVACEIIAVGPVQYFLPGIGSFLSRAAEQNQVAYMFWGLFALTLLILGMDFLVWRPLSIWAERFRQDYSSTTVALVPRVRQVYFQGAFARGVFRRLRPLSAPLRRMIRALSAPLLWLIREVLFPILWDLPSAVGRGFSRHIYLRLALPAMTRWRLLSAQFQWLKLIASWVLGLGLGAIAGSALIRWLGPPWPPLVKEIPRALLFSTLRLALTLALSTAVTLPIVLACWNRPKLRQFLSTISQIGASLPAVALFPLIVWVAVQRLGGGMEQATVMLLFTGMVWYVLFNGLGGASTIPVDLADATRAIGLDRGLTWQKLVIPAIRPALLTGVITAWGGGWNALVVSEYVPYRGQTMTVTGIGALLNRAVYQLGDTHAISLCLAAMIGWILIINTLVWRPLYQSAAERYKFDS